MGLWKRWWEATQRFGNACARKRTFMWLVVCLAGMSIRKDLLGVTSIVRALGLDDRCYDRILDFFHSPALDMIKLTRTWVRTMFEIHPALLYVNGRPVLVGDGIKVAKSGKKMPAVKLLHQESESNTKPEYIMGHSCQAVAVLARAEQSVFAVPLASRIHEGLVFGNRDHKTLLDKMIMLLDSLGLEQKCYFVADAYYASGKVVKGLLKNGHHLITMVKKNSVAYLPPGPRTPGKRGRPRKYGDKVYLRSYLENLDSMLSAPSPVYGEKDVTIRFRSMDLLWKPAGIMVRFVFVHHPTRGTMILMTTDLTLEPIEVIRIYGYRFKIEVSFKQAVRTIGAYAYHFWIRGMTPLKRSSGDQHLHRKSKEYRDAVRRKMEAYHRHIQIGVIAQGLLQYLASAYPGLIWKSFGSWIRTIRPGIPPSELVTAIALRNSLPEFIADSSSDSNFTKFLRERIDVTRAEGFQLIAVNE